MFFFHLKEVEKVNNTVKARGVVFAKKEMHPTLKELKGKWCTPVTTLMSMKIAVRPHGPHVHQNRN